VCSGNGIEQAEVLDLVLHLVDKSLVGAEEDAAGSPRYRLLETLRQYGLEQRPFIGGLRPSLAKHM
jgi:predicted ATPase